MLVVNAAPAAAQVSSPPFFGVDFTMSPVGGTPGTTIFLSGHCQGASEGNAYLEVPTYSDFILGPADSEHFTVNGGTFSATLQSPYGTTADGFPTDARVRVQCGFASAQRPFQGSNQSMGNSPSIFTSLGATPCGVGLVREGDDPRTPCPAHLKGFGGDGALAQTNIYPDGESSHGPSIAVGDVDGDGRADIVTGSGQGSQGVVRVYSPTGTYLAAQAVYPSQFTGGVNVAVGDVTGDGRNDVVTGAGPGGGPHVLVLSYNSSTRSFDTVGSFFAYDPGFHGGVNVAVGKFDSRNPAEIVTGPGAGGGPDVRRFTAAGATRGGFYAYDVGFAGGVNVATISDPFNGLGQIVTGAGPGGGPHVKVFASNGSPLYGFYAYDPAFAGGVSVAAGRVGGATQIVTGAGPGGGPHVRIFNTDGTLKSGGFYAYGPFSAGVKVAVAP